MIALSSTDNLYLTLFIVHFDLFVDESLDDSFRKQNVCVHLLTDIPWIRKTNINVQMIMVASLVAMSFARVTRMNALNSLLNAVTRISSYLQNILHDYAPQLLVLLVPMYVVYHSVSHASIYQYTFTLVIMLTVWFYALQNYFSYYVVDEKTIHLKTPQSKEPPTILNYRFWFKLINPFWKRRFSLSEKSIHYIKSNPDNISERLVAETETDTENMATSPTDKAVPSVYKVYLNVVYATESEINDAGPGSDRFMSMDIHLRTKAVSLRPIFIYVHGNHWNSSSRKTVPPFVRFIIN